MLSCADGFKAEFGRSYLMNLKLRDPQTEDHFAAYFSSYLENKLRGQLKSRDLAEDIRQETLVRVLEFVYTKETLRHPERFGAFVNAVCNNVLLEYWRRRRVAGETTELTEQIDDRRNPESAAQLAQDIAELRKVLPKLQKRDRDLLRMVYSEERDRQEVIKITRLSPDHLRVMLHRARRAALKYLEESRGRRVARASCSPPLHGARYPKHRRFRLR